MKQPELQPKMPQEQLALFLGLLCAGFVLLYFLLKRGVISGQLLPGVMTSLLIVSGVELIPELLRWLRNRSKQGKFQEFFGETVFKEDVHLVFPCRTLDPAIEKDPFVTHYKPVAEQMPHAEGVDGWLAFQDVRAAVYVANTISEMTGRHVIAVHDKTVEDDPMHFNIVSFGLGFTGFTAQAQAAFQAARGGVPKILLARMSSLLLSTQ